jgi:hypothetical protein
LAFATSHQCSSGRWNLFCGGLNYEAFLVYLDNVIAVNMDVSNMGIWGVLLQVIEGQGRVAAY